MSTTEEHTQHLDQLQSEVNRVLENIGRLFAAAGNGNKSGAAAQASRLKKDLPESIDRFHETLDQLEDELQMAKAVMRRDLAVCRVKSGIKPAEPMKNAMAEPAKGVVVKPQVVQTQPSVEAKTDEAESESTATNGIAEKPEPDAEAPPPNEPEPPSQPQAETSKPETDEQAPAPGALPPLADEQAAQHQAPEPDSKPPDSTLHLDTLPKEPSPTNPDKAHPEDADDEKPPDTAATDTRDLDSLFNDPASAGGGAGNLGSGADTVNSTDFHIDSNDATNDDFDFGAFVANDLSNPGAENENENDSLSALLPGLQDYANNNNAQPLVSTAADHDFDALFAADDAPPGEGQGGEQTDTTFDDLMNFGDFGAGDYGGGEGGEGDQDFDFGFGE